MQVVNPINRKINENDYIIFREKLKRLDLQPSLQIFKDPSIVKEVASIGIELFSSLINEANKELIDSFVAISVLDIPTINSISREEDAFIGIAASLSIIWNLLSPSIDTANSTPFTVYTASSENGEKLEAAQVAYNVPGVKLGFHNDGLIEGDNILVPDIITIYNILIAYKNPGRFHWVPFSKWNEMEKFSELFGIGKKYKFKIVPNVYAKQNDQLDIHGPNEITVPIFSNTNTGELMMFLNGEIASHEDGSSVATELKKNLKNSLDFNPFRFSVEQKARRLILLGNSLGCHSRDIFEEPIQDARLTRAFIRSVDRTGVKLL